MLFTSLLIVYVILRSFGEAEHDLAIIRNQDPKSKDFMINSRKWHFLSRIDIMSTHMLIALLTAKTLLTWFILYVIFDTIWWIIHDTWIIYKLTGTLTYIDKYDTFDNIMRRIFGKDGGLKLLFIKVFILLFFIALFFIIM